MLTIELFEKAGYNPGMIIPQEQSEQEVERMLVEGLKSGDEQAFRTFVEKYQNRAFSIAFGYMRDNEEAKDAVQESFIRVFEKAKSFKGDSKFYTWYYRLLVNICLDAKRKKKVAEVFSIFRMGKNEEGDKEYETALKANEKENPEEKYLAAETEKRIMRCLEKLSGKEKQVFELKHYQGFKIREVADIMGLKEGTVKVLLFRGVLKMKKMHKGGEL